MIVGQLQQSERIETLNADFKMIFDYIKEHDMLKAELGRVEFDGDRVFMNIVDSQTVSRDTQILEGHKEYLDIHIPIIGSETIGWLNRDDAKNVCREYDEAKDIMFFSDKPSMYVDLNPFEYCIIYPEDLHAPIIGEGIIRKLIVKIKL